MKKIFNGGDLKMFFQIYGDDDVYYSHEYMADGTLEIKYFPHLLKFIQNEDLDEFVSRFKDRPRLVDEYAKVLVLTDKFAYIPNDNKSDKNPLVKNYPKFLKNFNRSLNSEYIK